MIECYLCGDSFIMPANGEHHEQGWACEECVYVSGLMDEMKHEETQKNEFKEEPNPHRAAHRAYPAGRSAP